MEKIIEISNLEFYNKINCSSETIRLKFTLELKVKRNRTNFVNFQITALIYAQNKIFNLKLKYDIRTNPLRDLHTIKIKMFLN